MRIIQRNKYRIPAITTSLDTLLKEVSFQDDDDEEEEENDEEKKEKLNDEEKKEKLNDEEKKEKLNDEEKKEKLNDESSVVSQMNEMNQSNLIPPPSQSTTEVIITISLLIRFFMNVVFVVMDQLLLPFHSVLTHILIINIQFMNKENERLHPLFPYQTQVIV